MTDIQQIRDTIELTHNPDPLIAGAARLRILDSAEEYVTTLLDYIDRIGADEEAPPATSPPASMTRRPPDKRRARATRRRGPPIHGGPRRQSLTEHP